MTSTWEHRRAATAADLDPAPPEMPADQAQRWCNFVVWTPRVLPPGTTARTGTVRREAPPGRAGGHTAGRTPWSENNPSAYRQEVSGPGRRLRVKQFLYDWAFPALDQPCLWKSATTAMPIDDEYVLWIGTDYLGNRAASARLARTTIELSVFSGEFTDAELLDFYRGLVPADPAALEAIAATPFAALSYWARRPDATHVNVPVGLWAHRRPYEHTTTWTAGAEAADLARAAGLPAALGGLALDSAGQAVVSLDGRELELVYAGGRHRGAELRLIAGEAGEGWVAVPPEPEPHPARRERIELAGVEVHLAWIDGGYGPFDAVLAGPDGRTAQLLSSTGVARSRDWFLGAVRELLEALR